MAYTYHIHLERPAPDPGFCEPRQIEAYRLRDVTFRNPLAKDDAVFIECGSTSLYVGTVRKISHIGTGPYSKKDLICSDAYVLMKEGCDKDQMFHPDLEKILQKYMTRVGRITEKP